MTSFFHYCQSNFSKNLQGAKIDDNGRPARQTVTRITTLPNGLKHEEEIDMLTDFSWRNFFSVINFAKIMQKLSKHRSHRIRMLVQYKSSVGLFSASGRGHITDVRWHVGRSEAYLESTASDAATACAQVDQEPSAVLRPEMEAM